MRVKLIKTWPLTISPWYNSEKLKKYEIRFTGKTMWFWRDFQTLNARAARAALSSIVYQFCIPKSSYFMRETTVKRISCFLEISMLYEVYKPQKLKCLKMVVSVGVFINSLNWYNLLKSFSDLQLRHKKHFSIISQGVEEGEKLDCLFQFLVVSCGAWRVISKWLL